MKIVRKTPVALFRSTAGMTCILAALTVSSSQVLAGAAMETDVKHADQWADSVTSPEEPSAARAPGHELKLDYSTTPVALEVHLEPASAPKPSTAESEGGPLRIAFYREIPEELEAASLSQLAWTALDDGSIVSSMSVTSPGAVHIRLGLDVELPPGGEMRFFDPDSSQHLHTITETSLAGTGVEDRTLWSPLVQGDSIGVEVVLPSQKTLSAFSLSVERISHGYIDPLGLSAVGPEPAAAFLDCPTQHVDVACRVGRFKSGLDRSVAKILFQTSSGGGACSGTLLSERIRDVLIPYFLTAYHCISTQEAADSVVALWLYKRDACGGSRITQYLQSDHLGAELLDFSSLRDSALLRFRGTMPRGLLYAGWRNGTIGNGTPVYGLHHPGGGVMKYAYGTKTGRYSYRLEESGQRVHEAYVVNWIDGTTEPGSSGSGLFDSTTGQLVGVNSAWTGRCDRQSFYGVFSVFWPVVDRWLKPTQATSLRFPAIMLEDVDGNANDYFKIEVPADGTLHLETAGIRDTVGTLFGRYEQRAFDDNSGSGQNFRIAAEVVPGTYHLEVRGADIRVHGGYALHTALVAFEDDHGDVPEKATLVLVPRSTAGRLGRRSDVDHFRFVAPREGLLRIETTGSVDTVGRLLVGGEVVGFNDDGGDGNNFRIVSEVQAGSHYVVSVRGYAGQVGDYTLNLQYEESRSSIPLFMADNSHLQGFARIINWSNRAGTVEIRAFDEAGERFGPLSLSIDARQVVHFNSEDLVHGNPGKGLSAGVGSRGTGHWQLGLSSTLDIEVRAYNRSPDGFLTSIHETVEDTHPSNDTHIYYVAIFNPARNTAQVSLLRLINRGREPADIYIAGRDDVGHRRPESGGDIHLEVGAGEAVTLTAQQLEQGDPGFSRFLGGGEGKWQLWVTSDQPLHVMSLLRSPNGNVANLSR